MRKLVIATMIILTAAPAFAAGKRMTEKQKTLYAVGLVIARQLAVFELTPAEYRYVRKGIRDGLRGKKPLVDFAEYSKKSQELGIARRDAHGKRLERKAKAFIEKAARQPGAVKTASGVVYQPLKEGTGSPPTDENSVKIDYTSTLVDGKEMVSTYKNGEPDEAVVKELMPCLATGVKMMKPGGRARLVCPPDTALKGEGYGVIPPNATLVFNVVLREVTLPAEKPEVPHAAPGD